MALQDFVEERLDMGYDYGAAGGPEFRTEIVEDAGGHEARNAAWQHPRGDWDLGSRNVSKTRLDYLQAFFRARRGRAVGFRYRDWADYQAAAEPLSATGKPQLQLTKTYASTAGDAYVRPIFKPIAGITMTRGGAAFSGYSLDTTTGVVTLDPDGSVPISNIWQDTVGTVAAASHGYATGDVIYINDVTGMTALNGNVYTIQVIDVDHFALQVDTTGYTAYTGGGHANKYAQPGETLTWSGEFDVPARFDTDRFRASFEAYRASDGAAIFHLDSMPVIELKADEVLA